VGAAIFAEGRCLVGKRGPGRSFAGQWEFPGGKVEPDEQPEAALVREIREELGIEIEVGAWLGRGTAQDLGREIVLDVYAAHRVSGALAATEHAEIAWLSADELEQLDWAEADVPIVAIVRATLLDLP
jgi:8-oxo-dGTP diphosphatase